MSIKTVKKRTIHLTESENGMTCYIVNNCVNVPEDEKNADYQAILRWVDSGGVIET